MDHLENKDAKEKIIEMIEDLIKQIMSKIRLMNYKRPVTENTT